MRADQVSVVIINHNYGRFLQHAIDSARGQRGAAVEIVVVDDGSTDESGAILDDMASEIVQVRQSKGGHCRALNAGFAASSGELVIFLDADDMLYAECVGTVLDAWRPGCVKLQYRLDTVDAEGRDLDLPFPTYPRDLGPSAVRQRALRTGSYPWPVSSGNAYARSYLNQVLPVDAETIFKSPDGFLNKMAPLFGDVVTIAAVLAAYRVHGCNAWAYQASSTSLPNYARTVRFDAVLHQSFVDRAAAQGNEIGRYEVMPVPAWLEMRLLCLRLARPEHPLPGDTMSLALRQALRASVIAPDLTVFGRALWCAWFLIISILPKSMLTSVVRSGRSQSRRNVLARIAVSWAKRS